MVNTGYIQHSAINVQIVLRFLRTHYNKYNIRHKLITESIVASYKQVIMTQHEIMIASIHDLQTECKLNHPLLSFEHIVRMLASA